MKKFILLISVVLLTLCLLSCSDKKMGTITGPEPPRATVAAFESSAAERVAVFVGEGVAIVNKDGTVFCEINPKKGDTREAKIIKAATDKISDAAAILKTEGLLSSTKFFTYLNKYGQVISISIPFEDGGDEPKYNVKMDGVVSIAGVNDSKMLGITPDGTVKVNDTSGRYDGVSFAEAENWKDIKKIAAGYSVAAGLKTDGTVVAVGDNGKNQLDGVKEWKNIKDIYVCDHRNTVSDPQTTYPACVIGVTDDGRVLVSGFHKLSEFMTSLTYVEKIEARSHSVTVLFKDKTVKVYAGGAYGAPVAEGRSELTSTLSDVKDVSVSIAESDTEAWSVIIKEDNSVSFISAILRDTGWPEDITNASLR